MDYIDREGTPVTVGSILMYDEGDGGSMGVHEVVERHRALMGRTHLFDLNDAWVIQPVDDVVKLKYYTRNSNSDKLTDALVIGKMPDDAHMLTLEYVNEHHPGESWHGE